VHIDAFSSFNSLVPSKSDWRALPDCRRNLRDTNTDRQSGADVERDSEAGVLECEDSVVEEEEGDLDYAYRDGE